ncbi:MAG TPA: hypothetical protein VFG74_12810 [Miltoncostaeaceae bacterium]|jgi:hypothetical protein|nr:hypothetical protein [Miltoncostaeaceae bacterium]
MLLGRVTIGDFDQFWSTFTGAGAAHRQKYGSSGARVFRNLGRPEEVFVLFDWSEEDYRRFMDDPETPGIMKTATLAGPPEMIAVVESVGETAS